MKKCIAFLLVFTMIFSLFVMPAAYADESDSNLIIKQDIIDTLDSSINYLYEADTLQDSGFSLSVRSRTYALNNGSRTGTYDPDTKAITKYLILNTKGEPSIQDGYNKGEEFVMGKSIADTYSESLGTAAGYHISGQPMKGASFKKITESGNNIIEFDFGNTGNNTPDELKGVQFRVSFGEETEIYHAQTGKLNSGAIGYEWKFKIPENSAKLMTVDNQYHTIGGVAASGSFTKLLGDRTSYENGKLYHRVYKKDSSSVAQKIEITTDTWHTMKQVVIVDEETLTNGGYPLVMLYLDGELKCTLRANNPLTGSSYNTAGALEMGFGPKATGDSAVDSESFKIYLDDVKQYWIDDNFTISGINYNYFDFDPQNDKIEFTSSEHLDVEALVDAITVTKDGESAEVTATVTSKNDGYGAQITFEGMTADGSVYNVDISEFANIYGFKVQGKTFTVATCKNMTVLPKEADENIFTDTIETITEDNLFYPSSTSVNRGGISSAVVSANYALAGKTTKASSRTGVMKSDDSTNVIQFTNPIDDNGTRNSEDFKTVQYWYDQGYDTLVLGISIPSTNSDGKGTWTSDNTTSGWRVTGKPFDGAYLKASDSPTGEKDKVLEYNFGTTGNNLANVGMQGIYTRLTTGKTGAYIAKKSGDSYVADGRKIAYSWDVFVPAEVAPLFARSAYTHHALGGIKGTSSNNERLMSDKTYYSNGKLMYSVSGKDPQSGAAVSKSFEIPTDKWNTLMQVVAYDGSANPVVTMYLNGEKVTEIRSSITLLSDTTGYYPGQLLIAGGPVANSEVNSSVKYRFFIDDIKQYWVNNTFTVSGINESYIDFEQKSDKIEATYSSPVDKDALTSAITVKKDGVVAENVTASVTKKDDYTALISFDGMETSVATTYDVEISEFKDIYGNTSEGKIFKVTTLDVDYIINDSFDADTIVKNTNWATTSSAIPAGWKLKWMHGTYGRGEYTLNDDGVTYSFKNCAPISGAECSSTFSDTFLTDTYIGVVADPTNTNNNVIKYQAGKNGDGTHSARVYNNTSAVVDITKNIVMSSKILLTESLKNTMASDSYNDLPTLSTRSNYEDRFLEAKFQTSGDNLVLTANNGFTTTLKTDEWFELKYVILPNETVTETETAVKYGQWTFMVYINDILISVGDTTIFNGTNSSLTESGVQYSGAFATIGNTGLNMYGVQFGLYPKNNGETTPVLYVDDVKLYQPKKLSGIAQVDGAEVNVTYSNRISANSYNNFVITDKDGKVIPDAILSKTAGDDGKTISLVLDTSLLESSAVYNVLGAYDVYGQHAIVSFTTPKSYSLYIDSVTKADTSEAGKVKTTVKITNAKGTPLPAFLAVTVYSNYFEMIGIEFVEFDALGTEGYEEEIVVDITGHDASEIKSIKAHLWESASSIKPYQLSENIPF